MSLVEQTAEKKNEKPIQCKHCQSVILLANVGVWVDKTYDIPFPTQQKGVDTRKETLNGFWHVRDMYDFENVGFTNAVDGCKYLTCADCDFGPIGIVDPGSRQNLLTPERIQYKD
ncbi:unnamed protein product [Auanema sp. JU1783]|nr:unnamed protein product [Auanema sp. JU1783]